MHFLLTAMAQRRSTLVLAGFLSHVGPALLAHAGEGPIPALELPGSPVEKGWVTVIPADFNVRSQTFDVGAERRTLLLPGIPPGFALVLAGGEGMATSYRYLELTTDSPTTLPELTPGVRVTGTVARGRKPSLGAEVGLVPHPIPLRRQFFFPLDRRRDDGKLRFKVQSDAQGRYVLPHVAPGTYLLDVRFPGGRTLQSEPFTVPPPEALRRRRKPSAGDQAKLPPTLDLGETSISEGLELAVTAVDTAGQPVAGAQIAASQGDRLAGQGQSFEATADASGTTRLSDLSPNEGVTVFCRAPGFERWQQTFGSVPPTVRCNLARVTRLEGRVFDLDDRSIANARVSVKPHGSVSADREGRFALVGLPAGRHDLTVAAPGYRAYTARVPLAAEQTLALPPIRLERAEPFTGLVVDGETDEPVAEAVVTITDPPGAGAATTDAEGRFTLTADADGDLTLSIGAATYPAATFAVPTEDRHERKEPRTFELRAGGWIHATVWDEEADAPCAGCSVTLSPYGGASLGLSTDRNGEGLSSILPAGKFSVALTQVVSTGSEIRVSSGGQAREVEVLPGKTTRVRLGEARPALEVSFQPPPSPEMKLRVQAGSDDEITALAADGLYHARKRAGSGTRLTLLTGRIGDLEVLHAMLPDGFAKPYLRLPLAQTRLSGRLLQGRGSAGPAKIEIVSQDGRGGLAHGGADEQGYFTAAHLPPGRYTLLINGQSLRTLHLDEGQILDLGTLEIPSPALPAGTSPP